MLHLKLGRQRGISKEKVRSRPKPPKIKDLDGIMKDLTKTIHKKKAVKKPQLWGTLESTEDYSSNSISSSNEQEEKCRSFDTLSFEVTSSLMYCARDAGVLQIHNVVNESLKSIQEEGRDLSSVTLYADSKEECGKRLLKPWNPFPEQITERFFELEKETSDHFQNMLLYTEEMRKMHSKFSGQSMSATDTRIEAILAVLSQRQELVRQALQTNRTGYLQIQDIRATTLFGFSGMISVVEAIVTDMKKDTSDVVGHYQDFKNTINTLARTATGGEDRNFSVSWKELLDSYTTWLSSIGKLLPGMLDSTIQVSIVLQKCDARDDNCCLKQIEGMINQVMRIRSAVQMLLHDSEDLEHDTSIIKTLQEEAKVVVTRWNAIQQEQEKITKDLESLSVHRQRLWSEKESLDAISSLEQKQQELEQKQQQLNQESKELQEELALVRQQMSEMSSTVEYHNIQIVQSNSQIWLDRLKEFQKTAQEESVKWKDIRNTEYQSKYTLHSETLKFLNNLRQTALDKNESASVFLVSDASQKIQEVSIQMQASLSVIEKNWETTEFSLKHLVGLTAGTEPLASILSDYIQHEKEWKEKEEHRYFMQMMSETVENCKKLVDDFQEWKKQYRE